MFNSIRGSLHLSENRRHKHALVFHLIFVPNIRRHWHEVVLSVHLDPVSGIVE